MADNEVNIQIKAATAQFEKSMDAVTAKTQGYSKSLLDAFAAFDSQQSKIPQGMKEAADATDKLSFATAGATREFIVLGHELVSGNFSRIPGSLMVLGERTGGLANILSGITPVTLGWVAAIGVTVAGIYEWVKADLSLADTLRQVQNNMELTGQSALFNAKQQETLITTLRVLSNASNETAETIVKDFSKAGELSLQLRANLVSMVGDFAAATDKSAPKAAEQLIKLFEQPDKAAQNLRHSVLELSAAQEEQIRTAALSGDIEKAQSLLFDALAAKVDDTRLKVGTFTRTLEEMHATWVTIGNDGIFSEKRSEFLPVEAIRENINGLFSILTTGTAKAEDGQRRLNNALREAADTERSSGLMLQRKIELTDKLQKLQAGAAAAEKMGNNADAQRWLAEAQEIQEQINNLRAKGVKQDVQAEIQASQEKVRLSQQSLQQKKELLDEEVSYGKLTKSEEITDLKLYAEAAYEQQLKILRDELKIKDLSVVETQRINNEILQLQAQHTTQMLKYDAQYAAEQKKLHQQELQAYKPVIDTIGRDFDTMLGGVLQGTQTWQQAMSRFFDNLAISAVESIAKIIAEWIVFEIVTKGQGTWSDFMTLEGKGGKGVSSLLPSFDVGAWNLPSDTLAMVHQGEMIIPAAQASSIRSGNSSIGGGSGSGSGGDTYIINLSAIDTQNGTQFLKNNIGTIVTQLSTQKRLNNQAFKQ